MNNWINEEIKLLCDEIEEKQRLIKQYNTKLAEIRRHRNWTFKDFAILNARFGEKKYNLGMISICKRRIFALQQGRFENKKQYHSTMIVI